MAAVSALFAATVSHGADERRLQEARTVDDDALAAQNRRDQIGELRRIELQVGILDRDDRSARLGQARAGSRCPCRRCAAAWMTRDRGCAGKSVEHFARAVGRAVVDDEDLALGGQGNSSSRAITAATVADSLKTGTMIETRRGHARPLVCLQLLR